MSVHQCPHCPLRYTYRTELEYHLREDHDPTRPTARTLVAATKVAAPQRSKRRIAQVP
jgi:hypothetical protein